MPRWVTRLHAWVYRRSGGRFLGRMGGQPVLLLQTIGRRSGRTRTTPVQYLERAARTARRDLPLMALVAAKPTTPWPATDRS